MSSRHDQISLQRSNIASQPATSALQKHRVSSATKDLKDVLEYKIEDLSRQLAEERQASRQSATTITRLQKDLTISKSHEKASGKEQLSKEIEHEKMLRVEAEHHLLEMTRESEACHSRLVSLQEHFKKMESLVHDVMQYKDKIDQLKQEKCSLAATYEANIQKFKGHISDLEWENMMLLNNMKKLESQINSKTEGHDKYNMLLERLWMVEGENSSLVMENEQQRGKYEICLDEIANQVVQALLAQKMLREECLKLQNRVRTLEFQNHHICTVFQQRMKMIAGGKAQADLSMYVEGSMESLQSMFSEQTAENSIGMPQMISPQSWVHECLQGDRNSITSFTGSIMSDIDIEYSPPQLKEFSCRTEIETEFPATPSSPKSKHINFLERENENKHIASTSAIMLSGINRSRSRSTSSLIRAHRQTLPQTESHSHTAGDSEFINQQPCLQNLTNQSCVQNPTNQNSGVQNMTSQNSGVQNQGKTAIAGTDNKKRSVVTMTNKEHSTNVPLSHSDPSITSQISQGLVSPANHVSKLPVHLPSTKISKEQLQLRRNSLKAEYSIRLENQNSRDNQANSSMPTLKLFVSKPSGIPTGNNNNSSLSVGHSSSPTGHLKPPSTIAGKSSSSGSKIPTVGKQTGNSLSSAAKLTHSKEKMAAKAVINKQKNAVLSKLVPPKSPTLRYSGIRTTLKTDIFTKVSVKTEISNFSQIPSQGCVASNTGTTVNLKTVHSLSPVISSRVVDNKIRWTTKPISNKPIINQPHFPIMGLTTLNHISPKSENDHLNLGTNFVNVPTSFSSTPTSCNQVSVNGAITRGQYFYDYSDEDSDSNMPRPMSKSFCVRVALPDDLLNHTLENTETSVDSDFSNSSQVVAEMDGNNEKDRKMSPVCENVKTSSVKTQNWKVQNMIGNNQNTGIMTSEAKHRLSGKPDIVKDTEKCVLRNLQKSSDVSQSPGSSMPHYRAKRPKSLVLWANENRFVYNECGLMSSSDVSRDEVTQKNVKEQEVISKVAKSVENNGEVLESSLKSSSNIDIHMNNSLTNTNIQTNKSLNNELQHEIKKSNHQKASVLKKPSKIPPPVANKPSYKKSLNENNKTNFQRPKSMEICVNTASVNNLKSYYTCVDGSLSIDVLKSESENCLITDGNKKSESERCLITGIKQKLNYSNLASTSTFDEVKVERSGSKDDGYSTMSSDIQPENIEKYSDAFENSTYNNDVLNSNLSLNSKNSVSNEDKLSGYGFLGHVKAMKLALESEYFKNATNAPLPQLPFTPVKSGLKPPKPILEKLLATKDTCKNNTDLEKEPTNVSNQEKMTVVMSKIPKVKQGNVTSKENNLIGNTSVSVVDSIKVAANKYLTQVSSNKLNESLCVSNNGNKMLQKPRFPVTNPSCSIKTPVKRLVQDVYMTPRYFTLTQGCSSVPPTSTPNMCLERFDELASFSPTVDGHAFLREHGYDSNGSLLDNGSDLTSLHISEDNILSDIPEEKDGYDSSVGGRSENTSITSMPTVNNVKKTLQQTAQHSHVSVMFEFTGTHKCYWSSCQGIIRAISDSEYEKQKHVKGSVNYEELYNRCVNMETLLERSSSESDMFNNYRGNKPVVALLPKLQRSRSAECLVDEIAVEERVQDIMKNNLMQQISNNVKSADKDGETFTNFVELLIQKGHVMDSKSHHNDWRAANVAFSKALNKKAVTKISSNQSNSGCTNSFAFEEKPEAANGELPVLGEEQKRFNSKFYSLCNTGSNHSISEKSENKTDDSKVQDICCKDENGILNLVCQNCKGKCKQYQDMRIPSEFDIISHQLQCLSETVNQLHRSLSSLNSENTDSNSESNEGDVALTSAIGNKDIDGYHWVEDEIFLSPYGGEITQGLSPFLIPSTSCDWINDYSGSENDNNEQVKANGGQCDLHDGMNNDCRQSSLTSCRNNYFKNSILANSIDKEGNFDSNHFISQRLQQEEERRESMKYDADITTQTPFQIYSRPSINYVQDYGKQRPLLKENTRLSPEKDTDDMEHVSEMCNVSEQTVEPLEMMTYGGSQDSLDDNIGVDNMMCHRLIGGQGHCVNNVQSQLEFTNNQFICYDNSDLQAKSDFNLVKNTASFVTSERSLKTNNLLGQSSQGKSGLTIHNSQMNQLCGLIMQNSKMNQSTTSEESTSFPVKRQRRKLRQRSKVEFQAKQGFVKVRKFSSNSTDESNDETSLDSCSDSEDEPAVNKQLVTATTKMTYV